MSFEEIIISRQSCIVEVTVNSKEENSFRLLSGFCPRIRPQESIQGTCKGLSIEKYDYSSRKCVKNCVLRSCCSAALKKKYKSHIQKTQEFFIMDKTTLIVVFLSGSTPSYQTQAEPLPATQKE